MGSIVGWRSERFRTRVFVLTATTVTVAIIGIVAVLTHAPMVFPSIGPTAFMLFAAPLIVEASPRNVFSGHLIAIVCGLAATAAFGLLRTAPDLEDITWQRLGAVTVAMAMSIGLMMWLQVQHAPAIATALIVSLGLIEDLQRLGIMVVSVVAVILLGALINRLRGVRTPRWAPPPDAARIAINVR